MTETTARAESSCKRCYRRKKRCDRTLPECRACLRAKESCSFLDDKTQVASYSIAYVEGLERRVKELERQLSVSPRPGLPQNDPFSWCWNQDPDAVLGSNILLSDDLVLQSSQMEWLGNPGANPGPTSPTDLTAKKAADNLTEELRALSLQAAAERYLGSSSGLSLAQLTETVLERLLPDQEGFVFDRAVDNASLQDPDGQFPFLTDLYTSFSSPLTLGSISGDPDIGDYESIDLSLFEVPHINNILDFYFAHSHTLYPIIKRDEFMAALWRIYADPLDPLTQSPLWQWRIWMVLAIGSTTYSSVSLTDESESARLYSKAMTYFQAAMRCGDLAGLEVLLLQVSYSFFNRIGPNTWLLVGVAARIATGLGLHTSETYGSLSVSVAEQRKRLFFSLYMMDRVVSLALGRPFAIQDEDITVETFADADDESIQADSIQLSSPLEPSTMVIPLHILALRRIAGRIGRQVHLAKGRQHQAPEEANEIILTLHKELIEWRRTMPFPLPNLQAKVPHLCSSWFDLNYYTHVVMLYRPSPLIPTLDASKLKTLAEAAGMAIRQAINLQRQQRFAFNWLNLVMVFHSLLSLMYTTASALPNNLYQGLDIAKAVDDLESGLELLDSFCKKFPSAKNIHRMVQAVLERVRISTANPIGV